MTQTLTRAFSLAQMVTPERVFPRLIAGSKRQVIRDLASRAAEHLDLDRGLVLEAVKECFELRSFGPACQVAIPHAYVKGIREPVGFLARVTPAIPFGAADGEPVDVVLLILSPEGEPGMCLRAMACAARRLRETSVREAIRSARGADAIYAVLADKDWIGWHQMPVPPQVSAQHPI